MIWYQQYACSRLYAITTLIHLIQCVHYYTPRPSLKQIILAVEKNNRLQITTLLIISG